MNKKLFELRATHLGTIGFRLGLLATCLSLGFMLGTIYITILYIPIVLIGYILPIITLGFVIALDNNYFAHLSAILESSDKIIKFLGFLITKAYFVTIPGIIGCIIGIVFLSLNKKEKHPVKITFCVIFLIVCVVITILTLGGAVNQALPIN